MKKDMMDGVWFKISGGIVIVLVTLLIFGLIIQQSFFPSKEQIESRELRLKCADLDLSTLSCSELGHYQVKCCGLTRSVFQAGACHERFSPWIIKCDSVDDGIVT